MFALQILKWTGIFLLVVAIAAPRCAHSAAPHSRLARLPSVDEEPTAPSPSDLPGTPFTPRPEVRRKPVLEEPPAVEEELPQPAADSPRPTPYEARDPTLVAADDYGFIESGDCLPRPVLQGEVHYLLLTRAPASSSLPLAVDNQTSAVLASGNSLKFGFDSALRASVGYRFCHVGTLELGYFQLFENSSHFAANSPQFPGVDVRAPGALGASGLGFNQFSQLHVDYSTQFSGFEINWVLGPGLHPTSSNLGCTDACPSQAGAGGGVSGEWFVGYRQLQLDERWGMLASGSGANAAQLDSYTVNVRNDLHGVQLGARWRWQHQRWGLDGRATAGLFGAHAEQQQQARDVWGNSLRSPGQGSSEGVAAVVEADVGVVYRIDPRWTLRAGYHLMWLQGVALATSQVDYGLDFSAGQGLQRDDALLLHGFQFGLEARW